ncbi:rhodanese-like domain-containing protein [bacterium]|nr:rhodanese-like domain-containing protein [bacterium]
MRQAAIFLQITLFVLLIGNTLVARETRDISQDDLLKGVQAKTISLLLDVRTVDEFNQGHVPGAVNIPHFELEGRLAEIIAYRNKEIVVYCRSGRRTEIALTILRDSGFSKLLHLKGDIIGWLENNRPLEK